MHCNGPLPQVKELYGLQEAEKKRQEEKKEDDDDKDF